MPYDKEQREADSRQSGWQKETITKQRYKDDLIPHPAAAPMSTDQEAGGAVSTPEGDKAYTK